MDNEQMIFSVSTDELNVQALAVRSMSYIEKIDKQLETLEPSVSNPDKLISYIWSYEAKNVVILIRDTMLELLKLEQYEKDGNRTVDQSDNYKSKLQSLIHEATYGLYASLEQKQKGEENIENEWKHQIPPHHFILAQIKVLADQIKMIQRSQHKIDRLDTKLHNYKSNYKDYISQRYTRLQKLNSLALGIKENVSIEQNTIDSKDVKLILDKTQSAINELELLSPLPSYDQIFLEDVDKLKVPVSKQEAKLVYKSVEVLSELSGWTSIKIDNPLKSVDARIHSYTEQMRSGFFQILNRLKAKYESASQDLNLKKKDALYPLDKLLTEYKTELNTSVVEKLNAIDKDINDHIQTSQIFSKEHNFLPALTLDQVTNFSGNSVLERRYNWSNIKGKIDTWSRTVFSKYTDEEQLSSAGYIDKVLSFNPESDVNALFLRKGFLGSSFTIERKDILHKVKTHYELWSSGYGGSLLIKGGHGTGRTTILEMIPILYPDVPSYHIINDQKLDVNGNVIDVRNNLVAVIKHIIKYAGGIPSIVTIDDIGDYSNSPESTFDLIANLLKVIRRYNEKIYFAISIHNYLAQKLEHYFDLKNPFNEILNVDYMPSSSIQEAVMIRARAVANLDQLDTQSDTIASMARKVARRARNNVGRGMQLWCMMHGEYENDNGDLKFRELVKENEELIRLLFANGLVYEPYLRSMLNDIDANGFKSNIRYLARIKFLVREGRGYIKINPFLQSTIEAIIS